MPNRTAPVARLGAMVGAAVLAIAACSSSSSPATSSPGAASTPAAASSAPAASSDVTSPATTLPTSVPPSGALPSIPSFHSDAELEAQLPNTLCNQTVTKASFSGPDATNSADLLALISQLGKSPNDLSIASAGVAGPECQGLTALAIRVKGADQGQFQQLFLAGFAKSNGAAPTQSNVGGKNIWSYPDTSGGKVNYIYFKGDTAFGVSANSAADAGKGLSAMP